MFLKYTNLKKKITNATFTPGASAETGARAWAGPARRNWFVLPLASTKHTITIMHILRNTWHKFVNTVTGCQQHYQRCFQALAATTESVYANGTENSVSIILSYTGWDLRFRFGRYTRKEGTKGRHPMTQKDTILY